jgi:hypothetical protein
MGMYLLSTGKNLVSFRSSPFDGNIIYASISMEKVNKAKIIYVVNNPYRLIDIMPDSAMLLKESLETL